MRSSTLLPCLAVAALLVAVCVTTTKAEPPPSAPAIVPALPAATGDPVADALEDFRRITILYHVGEESRGTPPLRGPDYERLDLFPFVGAWPPVPSFRSTTHAAKFRRVRPGGGGYVEESGDGFSFADPLDFGITPVGDNFGQTLLFLKGIGPRGAVVTRTYLTAYSGGDMAGLINSTSAALVVIRGDLTGNVIAAPGNVVVVCGKTRGRLSLAQGATAYLLGGAAPEAKITLQGGRAYLTGPTPESGLAPFAGQGNITLEESPDTAPGKYQRGGLEVTIKHGPATAGAAAKPETLPAAEATDEELAPLPPPHLRPFPSGKDVEDVADVSQEDLRAGGDTDMRYALIGPKARDSSPPTGGYKLLLVLAGGDGGPDFNPFVRRLAKNALPAGYLVAHLVAPVWDEQESKRIVWPTAKSRVKNMRFTTEEFIAAVVKDVAKRRHIDPARVYALGWSSSGPPLYASALSTGTPLAGAFVAMSVFPEGDLPPLSGAKGHAFYLLHSPQDFIRIEQAEAARDHLAAAGAKTTLTTYKGGHGWTEDPFGNIRRGMVWLEQTAGR